MLKLKQYLKPYIALLLGAVILLFGQAMLELTLPNYMSDIVNVGLQQGGITYASPEAIDTQSMQLMQRFMSNRSGSWLQTIICSWMKANSLHSCKRPTESEGGRLCPDRRAQ